jgi:hypothetical protein
MSADIMDLIKLLTERQRIEFALGCARRVQHLMRDPRSVAAIDTRERWLRGEATDEEMDAAVVAAGEAAWAAEWEAAGDVDVASDVATAWAAVWAAEGEAARAAAQNAAAARYVERAWQRKELARMLEGGGA